MANKSRKFYTQTYGSLYRWADGVDKRYCAYCGDTFEHVDHVPPISLVHKIGTQSLQEQEVDLLKYPSCAPCNLALGSKPLATYTERLLFLYDYFQSKLNGKVIWEDDELDELSGNLKQMVLARQLHIRKEYLERIRGLERSICTKL